MRSIIQLLIFIISMIPLMAIAQTKLGQNYLDRGITKDRAGEKDDLNLPTVENAIEIEKSIDKTVKLVGVYIGTASILSHKESSSGGTFLVLKAKIVTSDNISISLYSNKMMLKQQMRSIEEIEKYHDREVVVMGKIVKKGNYLSIVPEKIERRRSW